MNSQFKKGALELCVLSQLALRDQYGYELTENISKEMKLAAGTLYLILKRLRDEEYVETYLVEAGDKRGGLADIAEVVCVGAAGQSGAACGLNGDELDVVFALKAIGHEGGDNAAEV